MKEAYRKKRENEMGLDYTSCSMWKFQFGHQDNQTIGEQNLVGEFRTVLEDLSKARGLASLFILVVLR